MCDPLSSATNAVCTKKNWCFIYVHICISTYAAPLSPAGGMLCSSILYTLFVITECRSMTAINCSIERAMMALGGTWTTKWTPHLFLRMPNAQTAKLFGEKRSETSYEWIYKWQRSVGLFWASKHNNWGVFSPGICKTKRNRNSRPAPTIKPNPRSRAGQNVASLPVVRKWLVIACWFFVCFRFFRCAVCAKPAHSQCGDAHIRK